MKKIFETLNQNQTEKLGEALGKLLKAGDFLALAGDLGAGKTAFTRGIARGLGIHEDITSPTFTIINQYEAPVPLAHMDAYRLKTPEELENAGFYDYMEDFVVVLEWADRVEELLPGDVLWIYFTVLDENRRTIEFQSQTSHYDNILQELNL
ncbi:MAG: tRNA threonylcarbamoyladenosine biosynthesis protein TsaE [Thermoanaerobacteraceae bacterium]|uniref:tRNA threonylcarbamoyladenosine biosynthesis protein TsaE n=1 Tax=Biomaibacter acetigenes TaxID=2316383 RepID=A0A3G2R7R5_9FIRM|nr:tRNA (adenosine(37)-N6)-threonylcarbamoyltransferase complex ATPase subunit type 1 TsaE [Biomaibacter acetigenes]AYO31476.1 tRNA (adenosine(37)-N6)-threonylcarbamoyltransferase complex ATPase subunit type 1 TsaE [Biomaibacter acetigenes]MDK2879568.1 tRNA threonylcarbamoyladenosine biosynthesis protein TsaE [Thermoanaerobacteraceae bacterium]RKL62680.1 tRNA (adenosine(37)-N6)-threonylcarbamoyltransferase complex ATPase subunit type 1 TsaE [Thermoanaerobacteraceae bacterium SP2]